MARSCVWMKLFNEKTKKNAVVKSKIQFWTGRFEEVSPLVKLSGAFETV